MAMRSTPDLRQYCEAACIKLWGEPNRRTAKELRWNGADAYSARTYAISKHAWYDHGAERGGSTLDLVDYHKGRPQRDLHGSVFFEVWREANEMGIVPEPVPEPKLNGGGKPMLATYPYHDEQGALLYEVVRFDTTNPDERFRQRRPDGQGGWVWNLGSARRVLYRLPELIEGIAYGYLVLDCEGESDVEAARRLGYVATTHPGGVGKWRDEYNEFFRDADVVVIADNDAHGKGQADAEIRAQHLSRVAKRVRKIMFEVKDLREWVAAGGTREQLDALIESTPDWTPQPAQATRFKLVRFDQITLQTAAAYLVAGLIPRVGLIVIWGPMKCGKSFWAFDLFMHVALGWKYRERKVRQGDVVYLALEGHAGFNRRVEAFRKKHRITNAPFYLITDRTDLVKDHAELIAAIKTQSINPAAVVIDTLNRSIAGSESKDEDMSAYIKAADAIRDAFGCAVVVIHHCGIDEKRPRGHTSLGGSVDAQLAVKRDAGLNIVVKVEWMKDGDSEGDVITSKLERFEFDLKDDDGNALSSCVVMESEAPTVDATGDKLSPNQKTMFSILYDAGPHGLTVTQWNETARKAGLGTKRKADLFDLRTALHAKRLIYESNDRWVAKRT